MRSPASAPCPAAASHDSAGRRPMNRRGRGSSARCARRVSRPGSIPPATSSAPPASARGFRKRPRSSPARTSTPFPRAACSTARSASSRGSSACKSFARRRRVIAGRWWWPRGATRKAATAVSSARAPSVACSTPRVSTRWRRWTARGSWTRWPAPASTPIARPRRKRRRAPWRPTSSCTSSRAPGWKRRAYPSESSRRSWASGARAPSRGGDPAGLGDDARAMLATRPGDDPEGVRHAGPGPSASLLGGRPRRAEPRARRRRRDDLHSVPGRTQPPRRRDERPGGDRARSQRAPPHAARTGRRRGRLSGRRQEGPMSCCRAPIRRLVASMGALDVALGLGGCARDGPMTTLIARSDLARSILHLYKIITGVAVAIALIVAVVLVWILVRYRGRDGALPPQTRGHTALEIGWTIAPALGLLVIAVPTIQVIFRTQAPPVSADLEIRVLGHQWWWEFRYPSLDVVTANELHVPAGSPVALTLDGPDVIHSFWVPQLGGKRDVVPGRLNRLTFTPDTPGEYRGQCAEFCGLSHANMGLRVVVDAPATFERWIAAQKATSAEPTGPAAEGKAIYARSACVGCHTIRGVSTGSLGPDLTTFGSRRTLAAGMFPSTAATVAAWVKDPIALKPGSKMPALGLTDDQARAVAAYLLSLK